MTNDEFIALITKLERTAPEHCEYWTGQEVLALIAEAVRLRAKLSRIRDGYLAALELHV